VEPSFSLEKSELKILLRATLHLDSNIKLACSNTRFLLVAFREILIFSFGSIWASLFISQT